MTRRASLTAAALVGVSGLSGGRALAQQESDWEAFKRRFVRPEGRVVDTGNNGVSHSEGQGYGMLFAVANGDRETFDLLRDWTARVLQRKRDALHPWRYVPEGATHLPDQNNATDGDLAIAMALGRAAALWGRPEDLAAARAIALDIRRYCIVNAGPRLVMLPGRDGFADKAGVTANLSYYNFTGLAEMGRLDASPLWMLLAQDGLALIAEARFGRWDLPPDWISVSSEGQVTISGRYPPLSGFDAIRVPMNLVWNRTLSPAVAQSFQSFWTTAAAYQPAFANLKTDQVSTYPAPSGLVAVRDVTLAAATAQALPPTLPTVAEAPDYYSASLILLSRLAWQDSHAAANGAAP